jgi:signal transduction histidine kinase
MAVLVAPHLYETAWFRLAGGLVLAVTLGLGASWRARAAAARATAAAAELERMVGVRTAELAREKEVTARQAASLAELDRAKDRFFTNISHEFRTPLTLILGPLTDLVEGRNGVLPAAVRAHHAMMLRNGQRLLRLINQVLDLTRLESGQLPLDAQPVDLVAACRTTTMSFAPLAERRQIALEFHSAVGAAPARLDPPQFEKVLLNLLSNAFKFTEPGGRVAVRVAVDGDAALLAVEDSGVGIAPELLPRVFDRFFQADASATRRHEGSGIGLSLARELVELHRGTIDARSAPGAGSTFTVRLPLLTGRAGLVEPGATDATATEEPGGGPPARADAERAPRTPAPLTPAAAADGGACGASAPIRRTVRTGRATRWTRSAPPCWWSTTTPTSGPTCGQCSRRRTGCSRRRMARRGWRAPARRCRTWCWPTS